MFKKNTLNHYQKEFYIDDDDQEFSQYIMRKYNKVKIPNPKSIMTQKQSTQNIVSKYLEQKFPNKIDNLQQFPFIKINSQNKRKIGLLDNYFKKKRQENQIQMSKKYINKKKNIEKIVHRKKSNPIKQFNDYPVQLPYQFSASIIRQKKMKSIARSNDIAQHQQKIKQVNLQVKSQSQQKKKLKIQQRKHKKQKEITMYGNQIKLKNKIQNKLNNKTQFSFKISQIESILSKPLNKKNLNKRKTILKSIKSKNNISKISQKLFLSSINFSNGIFIDLQKNKNHIKTFVGKGNNQAIVKAVLKKRPYIEICNKKQLCQLFWTQNKIKNIFSLQKQWNISNEMYNFLNQVDQELSSQELEKLLNQNQKEYLEFFRKNQVQQKKCLSQYYLKKLELDTQYFIIHNHFPKNHIIANKKSLFHYLKKYYKKKGDDIFDNIPVTFHISNGIYDSQYARFLNYFKKNSQSLYLIKPGQHTNRGQGIHIVQKQSQIQQKLLTFKIKNRTFIIQKYIQPFLYNDRKFDIRCFMLLTQINGRIKAYFMNQGYLRTSGYIFSLRDTNPLIHLTNDSIQKKSAMYSHFQKGNKIQFRQFQRYLNVKFKEKQYSIEKLMSHAKKLAKDVMYSTYNLLNPKKKAINFQIFGLDFMLDKDLKLWLIEINSNPCLQTPCNLLLRIIYQLLDHSFKIALDPLLKQVDCEKSGYEANKFQLIFDEVQ